MEVKLKTEMERLKQYFPYRIIYGIIDKTTGAYSAHAVTSMRIPNKLAKEGHQVFIAR